MAPQHAPRISCFSPDRLNRITDEYNEENCIGRFQFGKVFRGVGEYSDTVLKVYEKKVDNYEVRPGDNEARVQDGDCLAHDDYVLSHPNIAKFMAISMAAGTPAVVYDIEAKDLLCNLIDKDSFSWIQRVKVSYGFASALKHMHDCRPIPYIICNISTAHILLDQEYNPKLYDFSMMSGGYLTDKRELLNRYVHGCHGYIDPDYLCNGKWSDKCDIFAYGVVLIGLLSKKVAVDKPKKINPDPFLYEWAYANYQKNKTEQNFEGCMLSLVHQSLEADAVFSMNDGVSLTKLAMQCVDPDPMKRPTMKQVVRRLKKLSIFQSHGDLLCNGNVPAARSFSISGFGKMMVKESKLYSKMGLDMLKALVNKRTLKGHSKMTKKGLPFHPPTILSYEDLKQIAGGFSEENYIDIHQFGKLYHGKIESKVVTVKTWEDVDTCPLWDGDNESRIRDELVLLQHPEFVSHPYIVKMIGYSYDYGRLGVVYDLESLDCLVNLIEKDSFSWRHRMEFALKLAEVLKFLQETKPPYEPYVLRNFVPNNILVDKNYSPQLFNFGFSSGGILNDKDHSLIRRAYGWWYYTDPYTNNIDYYTTVSDIFSFGMVLLNLIAKKIDMDEEPQYNHQWAYEEYAKALLKGRSGLRNFSLVHKSFGTESDFKSIQGRRVSKLIMRCISRDYSKRPTIGQVVNCLQKYISH